MYGDAQTGKKGGGVFYAVPAQQKKVIGEKALSEQRYQRYVLLKLNMWPL